MVTRYLIQKENTQKFAQKTVMKMLYLHYQVRRKWL